MLKDQNLGSLYIHLLEQVILETVKNECLLRIENKKIDLDSETAIDKLLLALPEIRSFERAKFRLLQAVERQDFSEHGSAQFLIDGELVQLSLVTSTRKDAPQVENAQGPWIRMTLRGQARLLEVAKKD